MRSLVLSLVLGLAALGTVGLPAVADAHPYGGYGGYGGYGRSWRGGSRYGWQGGGNYWRGGSHYRWQGGSRYYNPGYYNYGGYYTPNLGVYTVPSPVYQYSPGAVIYYNSGYRAFYP